LGGRPSKILSKEFPPYYTSARHTSVKLGLVTGFFNCKSISGYHELIEVLEAPPGAHREKTT
jgi:hypothetical protein